MLRLIDLFCGCGGMTLGFVQTGRFEVVWANDFDAAALSSYRANFDAGGEHSHHGDIAVLLDADFRFPAADVVIGGPPCQGFSLLNKGRANDRRKSLWREFLAVVEKVEAKVAVMENVPQLLRSSEHHQIEAELRRQGFRHIAAGVLNAADYGVPQLRRRAVIIASRIGAIALPAPSRAHPQLRQDVPRWLTVRDAVGDLPVPHGTSMTGAPPLDLHFSRTPTEVSLQRYRAVPPGGNRFDLQRNRPDITPACWLNKPTGSTDLFGRLWWERPSVTIRTEFFKPEKGRYLHPEQDRPITHREAARLQSFPDDFIFRGSKAEIAKQIGNAVPPLLAKAIARQVEAAFEREK